MKKMKGWRTIVGNVIGGLALIGAGFGLDVTPDQQTALIGGIGAAIGIFNTVMRFLTTTPIGKKS